MVFSGSNWLSTNRTTAGIVSGRSHVVPDDVRGLAVSVLAHRLQLRTGPDTARSRAVVSEVVSRVVVPTP